jgi:hypothetical protein
MSELKFKVLGDFTDFKRELQNLLKNKFKVGTSDGSDNDKKKSDSNNKGILNSLKYELKEINKQRDAAKTTEELKTLNSKQEELINSINKLESEGTKKQTSILGMMFKKLGWLAVLASLKPMQNIFEILKNFVMLGILIIIKWLKNIGSWIGEVGKWIGEKLAQGWKWLSEKFGNIMEKVKEKIAEWWGIAIEWLKELPGKIWEFLKELPGKIWEFLKELPGKIWEFLQLGFGWIREKLSEGWASLKEKFNELKDRTIEKFNELREKFIQYILDLKDKLVDQFNKLKDKFVEKILELKDNFIKHVIELKDKFVEKIMEMRDKIIEMKDQFIQNIKDLPGRIASSISSAIRSFASMFKKDKDEDSSSSTKTTKVNDAIITKTGQVIKTHPDDTIIATKTPGSMGGSQTINFYGMQLPEAIEMVKRELGRDKIKSTRF